MQVKTYSGLWNVENRLYKFYDINLPFPVSVKQIGLALGSFIPWFFILHLIGVPLSPPIGPLIWFAPPGIFTWLGNKPVAEGKSLFDYVYAQVAYMVNGKTYVALAPKSITEDTHLVDGRFWHRNSK